MAGVAVRLACVLCGSTSSTLVWHGVRYDPDVDVRRCDTCGLVFQSPLPTQAQLDAYYGDRYRAEYGEDSVEERYEADRAEAAARVDRIVTLAGGGALLEVGTGSGAFVEAVRPHVERVVGVEPDVATRSWLSERGNEVVADLADLDDGAQFDVVVLFHVLEHVLDPVAFLHRLAVHLRPQGALVVEVPNVGDALVEVYRVPTYLPFYYQKAHLWYFGRATLGAAFQAAALEVEIEGVQRYGLGNHIHWMLAGEPGGEGRFGEVVDAAADAAYRHSVVASGHADTLCAIGRPTDHAFS